MSFVQRIQVAWEASIRVARAILVPELEALHRRRVEGERAR